jgi:hypothetical protein
MAPRVPLIRIPLLRERYPGNPTPTVPSVRSRRSTAAMFSPG